MKKITGMTLWILLVSLLFGIAGCGGGGGGSSTGGGGTDTTAPTAPSALVAAAASSSAISLNWTASTDDVGVSGYKIYRGGTQISTSATNSFSDSGLAAWTYYSYTVAAYDAAGNTSTRSTSASETTFAPGVATPGANFKMPDTGQTTSYTTSFGEDHDYAINPPSYTDNGNGTITDNVTGLVWQKQDDSVGKTWDNAITFCDNLTLGSQTDWRLPSRIELISIVDYGTYGPAINTTYYPGTISGYYWSTSAIDASNTSDMWPWCVMFRDGLADHNLATNSYYVRCVRGGQ